MVLSKFRSSVAWVVLDAVAVGAAIRGFVNDGGLGWGLVVGVWSALLVFEVRRLLRFGDAIVGA